MNDWRSRFEPRPQGASAASPMPQREVAGLDEDLALDLSVYRPWVLQRGQGRPVMMLDLRRYEPKSGFWTGWAIAYPQLAAVEYVGDRMLSLDFGVRKFVVEGDGLRELTERLQQGAVLAIQEYCSAVWKQRPEGPLISSIRRAGMETGAPQR